MQQSNEQTGFGRNGIAAIGCSRLTTVKNSATQTAVMTVDSHDSPFVRHVCPSVWPLRPSVHPFVHLHVIRLDVAHVKWEPPTSVTDLTLSHVCVRYKALFMVLYSTITPTNATGVPHVNFSNMTTSQTKIKGDHSPTSVTDLTLIHLCVMYDAFFYGFVKQS